MSAAKPRHRIKAGRNVLPPDLTPAQRARIDEMPLQAGDLAIIVVEEGYALSFAPRADIRAQEIALLLPALLTLAAGRPIAGMTPFLEATGLSRHFTREALS